MNSYGPVSLAYEAIYKLLHYMNWFSNDVRVHVLDTEPMTTPNPNDNPNPNPNPNSNPNPNPNDVA